MQPEERYLFDLAGFLLVRGMIDPDHLAQIVRVVDNMEAQVRENVDKPPFFQGHYGIRYHQDPEYGYASYRDSHGGEQLIVDDFLNIDPVFDYFVGHERTMSYIREMILGPCCIRSMELRYRYPGNLTPTHMGSVIDLRNRYVFHGRPVLDTRSGQTEVRYFELTVARILYALHDITINDGPLCVVPGSHKANLPSPYGNRPENEPFMFGIPMNAGDAILFTENTRHGGLPIQSQRTRKTIHMTYQPVWTTSMCSAHWDSVLPLREDTVQRLTDAQKAYFWGSPILRKER